MNGLYCLVCGKRLPSHTANTMCGPACRQKRARDKRDAHKRAIMAAETIEGFLKLLTQDVISPSQARTLLYEVNGSLHKLWDMIEQKEAAQRAKEGSAETE